MAIGPTRSSLLTRWWASHATSRSARRSVTLWAAAEPTLADASDFAELAVEASRTASRGNEIGAALLRLASNDDDAELLLLWLATPLLRRLAWSARGYRSARWTGDRAGPWEFPDAIEDLTFELACRWIITNTGRRVAFPFATMRDTVRDGLRSAANAAWRDRASRDEWLERATAAQPDSADELAALLGEAVRGRLLSDDQADLVRRTRVDGCTIAEMAAELDVDPATVQKRRRRAELRLVAASR